MEGDARRIGDVQTLLNALEKAHAQHMDDLCFRLSRVEEADRNSKRRLHSFPSDEEDLREFALGFVSKNLQTIACTRNNCKELPLKAMNDLLSRDDLNIFDKISPYELMNKWVEHKEGERMEKLFALLQLIRFSYLPLEYLDDMTRHEFISRQPKCLDLIHEEILHRDDVIEEITPRKYNINAIWALTTAPYNSVHVINPYNWNVQQSFTYPLAEDEAESSNLVATTNQVFLIDSRGMKSLDRNTPADWQDRPLPPGRKMCRAATADADCIYLIGGHGEDNEESNAHRFGLSDELWQELPQMQKERWQATVISDGKYLCLRRTLPRIYSHLL